MSLRYHHTNNYSVMFSFWSNGNGKHQEAPSSLSLYVVLVFRLTTASIIRDDANFTSLAAIRSSFAATVTMPPRFVSCCSPQLVALSDATINGSCSSYQASHNLCWCYCWAIYCWRTLGSINQLFICIGILAALVAGLPLAGNPLWWRTMFGIAIIPSVLLALGMAFSPESPTWLYQQGKFSEAEMAIKRLFEKERVAEVMNDFSPASQGSS